MIDMRRNLGFGVFVLGVSLLSGTWSTADAEPTSPAGYVVVADSVSPDGTMQVLIPALADGKQPLCQTRLANVATGATIAVIQGECFFQHQNQIGFHPRWSKDSSTLLWHTDNKWGSANVQMVTVKDGKVAAQFDVREPAVKKIVAIVKKTTPKAARAAKKAGKGMGAWFRDGLSVDVKPVRGTIGWPLQISIDITSDPKCDQLARIGGTMQATVDESRKWTFADYSPGHKNCGQNNLECAFSDCD